MNDHARGARRLLGGLLTGLLLLVGLPTVLITVVGWPLPNQLPDTATLNAWLEHPLSPVVLLDLAACLLWLLWTALVVAIVIEIVARLRNINPPSIRWTGPVQGLAAGLVGAVGVAFAPAAHAQPAVHATPAATSASPQPTTDGTSDEDRPLPAHAPALPSGPGVVVVDGCAHPYTVRRGDSLSHIAELCLGDGNRWPEIWRLNRGRFWPNVSGHTRLTDPDLIYPRWTLNLPADATPPPARKPPPVPTQPDHGTQPAPPPPVPQPSPTAPTSTPSTPTTAGASTAGPTNDRDSEPASTTEDGGVALPGGSWIPWTLATAVLAAVTVMWAQRRRRYQPRPLHDPSPPPLPEPALLRHLHAASRTTTGSAAATAEPHQESVPGPGLVGVVGFTGPGAHAAARGALVTALSATTPVDPHAAARVAATADTLATLLQADPHTLMPWPRLHLAGTLDEALALIQQRLLYTARHDDDMADTPAPLLLITTEPPTETRSRLTTLFHAGEDAHVSAILLGPADTQNLHVNTDGTSHSLDQSHTAGGPARFAVVNPDQTLELLHTLREADGQPPTPATDTATVAPAAVTAQRLAVGTSIKDTRGGTATAHPAAVRVRIQTFGRPDIPDRPPHIPMRGYATEIMVYLAVHPNGATTEQLLDDLWPTERRHITANRLYTGMSNLRKILAATAGATAGNHIDKRNGRYRLNPDTVDIDLWNLRAAHTTARTTTDPTTRLDALHHACHLATNHLAAGETYDWIEPHRHGTLQLALDLHTALANTIKDTQPEQAAQLLTTAYHLDPLNEHLCHAAITAHRHTRNHDAIPPLLTTLTQALATIGEKPNPETLALARQTHTAGT